MKKGLFMFLSGMFLLSFLFVNFVSADSNCIPNLNTNEFYGKVYVNSHVLMGGNHTIIAMIGDKIVGAQKINSDGTYSIDVSPCPSVSTGKIYFYVGDVEADESGDYTYDNSVPRLISLNLTLNKYPNTVCGNEELNKGEECDDGNANGGDGCSEFCEIELGYSCKWDSGLGSVCTSVPFCGDGSCNNGESCSTCSTDCGACSSGGGSSGGGGGGGGGGSSTRKAPVISLSNSTNTTNSTNTSLALEGMDINSLNEQDNTKTKKGWFSFTAFTGSAINGIGNFAKSKVGIGLIVFIVLFILLAVLTSDKKLREENKMKKKMEKENGKIKVVKQSEKIKEQKSKTEKPKTEKKTVEKKAAPVKAKTETKKENTEKPKEEKKPEESKSEELK